MNVVEIIDDFKHVADLAGISLSESSISFEILSTPHTPPSKLPSGMMAVYIFLLDDECLKVGKVGT